MFDLHMIDAAVLPPIFGHWCDFIRKDDIVDGGAFSGTAIASGTIATQAGNGGLARLGAVATTDDSGYQIQGLASFVCTTGKTITYKCRGQLDETTSTNIATECDLYMGMFPVDTSLVASVPTSGIYFKKADGGTSIVCVLRVGGSDVFSQTISNTMDKSMHNYGISIQPNGTDSTVEWYIDGVSVARATGQTLPASSVVLTDSVAFQSGDNTGTKWFDCDYCGAFQLR